MELISFKPLWWLLIVVALFLGWRYSLVDAPLPKRLASFGSRVLAIMFLILALCRPFGFSESSSLHLIFLVDVSQSVDLESANKATLEVQKSIDQLKSNDSWSLFAFANGIRRFESSEELSRTIQSWQDEGSDDSFRSQTRIADSLLTSRLSFPAGKVRRLVVFSDGMETGDRLAETIAQIKEENIDVHLNRIDSLQKPEAAVVSFKPSSTRAFIGEVVRFSVELSANQQLVGKLRMVHRGVAVQTQDVTISGGNPEWYYFDVDMITPGDSRWTVELVPDQDHFLINNQRTCTVTVRGRPRILILHENEKEMRTLERALEEQDFFVDVRGKFGLPDSLQDLIAFDAILLADFPATSMNPRQMNLLKQYVQDFGGGLAMLGSENSFGLGGYHKTPVEEVLPLISRFEKEKEKPSLAMVLVIDKSGSMDGVPMALARQAAKAAVELLSARDQIGVIGFDGEPFIVNEIESASLKDSIFANVDSLQAGGGTNMYPAMVVGKEMLEDATAKIKHMICLSDGHTQEADHETLVQAMIDSGITVSTVALGDADRHLMATIADIGRGRYYETNDPGNVPQIFTKETMQASKSAIKEDLFGSVQTTDHPALAGFQDADLPFTLGYVMTQQKPTAQVLLVTETGDPLLAVSRFGLGVGLAYTSDLTERWGGEWLGWSECGKFWGQVIRSMVRKSDSDGIQIFDQTVEDRWNLDIRFQDSQRIPQSLVDWELNQIDDSGRSTAIEVAEIGLGKYQASIPVGGNENLTLRLRDPATNKIRVLHYDQAYPREYNLSNEVESAAKALAPISHVEIRSDIDPEPIRQSISHWFYLSALAFLLLGNLIRRL